MPVIGRLDEQTDAVLIAPLARKGARETDADTAARSHENTRRPRTATEVMSETEVSEEARGGREELPVWLL
jgi:hypothetical protein